MVLKLLQYCLIKPYCLVALLKIVEIWWLKVKSDENVILKSLICVTIGNTKFDIK